jgi:hypothetical protein
MTDQLTNRSAASVDLSVFGFIFVFDGDVSRTEHQSNRGHCRLESTANEYRTNAREKMTEMLPHQMSDAAIIVKTNDSINSERILFWNGFPFLIVSLMRTHKIAALV